MMRMLVWVLRALALVLLVRVALRALVGRRGGVPRQPRPGGAPPGGKLGGELVRDPQCGTYVPKARAFADTVKGEPVYFCSAACRDAYRVGARA